MQHTTQTDECKQSGADEPDAAGSARETATPETATPETATPAELVAEHRELSRIYYGEEYAAALRVELRPGGFTVYHPRRDVVQRAWGPGRVPNRLSQQGYHISIRWLRQRVERGERSANHPGAEAPLAPGATPGKENPCRSESIP